MQPPAIRSPSWLSRSWTRIRESIRPPRAQPAPRSLGVSVGRVAQAWRAEDDLSAMSKSPVVYAALQRRALGLASYPIRCYRGTQGRAVELDPERIPWVADLLRLLQTPDPADMGRLFPDRPGEGVIAQVVADLLAAGNAYVVVSVSGSGAITGLHRIHPRLMTRERAGDGSLLWVYRPSWGPAEVYPAGSVAHLRLLSWETSGMGELGVGAGTPLAPLIAAETSALEQTAAAISQGGPDIVVTGDGDISNAMLENDDTRQRIAARFTDALKQVGRRVMVLGGSLKITPASWQVADLKAPELLAASRASELMALGVTPISVGADSGTYTTAVQQSRVQAEWDEQIQMVLEAGLLRPLARYYAQQAGGHWSTRADQVTCRIDLSSHPGHAYARTDAIARMKSLKEMGWTAEQAAAAEGIDLPKPEGKPEASAAPAALPSSAPRRPLGDTEGDPGDPEQTPADGERGLWWGRGGEVVSLHHR